MNESNDNIEEMAEAFGQEMDPLREFQETFQTLDIDPFEEYKIKVLSPKDPAETTRNDYRYAIGRWKTYMTQVGRHPACPRKKDVKGFASFLKNQYGNQDSTITRRINAVQRIYNWWQEHHAFPHPSDYDPFALAKYELSLDGDDKKEFPELRLTDIRQIVRRCTNIRERFFLMFLLKLGLRVGELLNMKLSEISIDNRSVKEQYPSIGTADKIDGYNNAIYISPKFDRDGNKSSQARILPLDDELRQILIQFLAIRPTVDQPWLVLSERKYEKMDRGDRVNDVWKSHFAAYNGQEEYRDITSHYGRHYFSTYWKIHEDIPRELVQYMRGDKLGENNGESIDEYLFAHYTDIEELYLNRIFKLL